MPEAAGIKKAEQGSVALPLADLGRRKHRHPEMRPQTSPREDKSAALRATRSPATARKGGNQGESTGGPVKCLNRPRKGRPQLDFGFEIFLGVPSSGTRFPEDDVPGAFRGTNFCDRIFEKIFVLII